MTRSSLLTHLLPDVPGIAPDLAVCGLTMDSRSVRPGDAFVAIAGFGAHGLNFAGQACANGAAVILFDPGATGGLPAPADAVAVPGLRARLGAMADAFHDRLTTRMPVVGVTGTNGKTSTVQLIAQAWEIEGTRAGTIGTLGAGLHGDVRPTGFTTPLVLQLHALLADMVDAGAQAIAMEVSSHALDQGRVDGVHFDIAAFTNLSRDHLDYHGDMDTYGEAKARLFAWPGLRAAVVNVDDAFGARLAERLEPAASDRQRAADATVDRPLLVSVSALGNPDASIRAVDIRLDTHGIAFQLVIGETVAAVRSPLLGRFNVDNLLVVAGVLHAQGTAPARIAGLLSRLQPIHGRMNRLGGEAGAPLVVIDYAHTPDALEQALSTLRAHTEARVLCVFGCGGERDVGKRPQMGAIAERLGDIAIVTDDNPRGEDGELIAAQIVAGFADPSRAIVVRDRKAAIARAIGEANPDDIVLIAGKGHEPDQEIAGVRHPFDDTCVARELLARHAATTHGLKQQDAEERP